MCSQGEHEFGIIASTPSDFVRGSAMYRIELKPGEENVFRTLEELATGIRNGLVTPRARIFHNASQKWLPIEFHPHYKKALSMPPTKPGETPAVGVKSSKSSETHAHPSNRSKVVEIPSAVPPATPALVPPPLPAHGPVARTKELTFIPTDPPKPAPTPEPVLAQVPAPVRERPAAAVVSPVVDLPAITYKDTAKDTTRQAEPARHVEAPRAAETPRPVEAARHAETAHHDEPVHHHEPVHHEEPSLPVAHQPLTRTEVRRIKPVYLGAIAAVLVVGSYVALSAATPATKTEASAQETPKPETIVASPPPPPAGYDPSADSSPTHRATLGTASSSGPTFGGLPAPAAAKPPIVTSAGASPAASAAKDSATIEPAPATVDISVPSLPSGDSLAPTQSDTGMRRILRAVGGNGAPDSRP
jgi:hypothetical protein